jgi:cytochrome c6
MTICALLMSGSASIVLADEGMDLFNKHCAVCHPDGGNIIKPEDTLKKGHLAKEGITDWQGIVKMMRNPEPGMTKFDAKTISDKDAKKIAEYVLKTFK